MSFCVFVLLVKFVFFVFVVFVVVVVLLMFLFVGVMIYVMMMDDELFDKVGVVVVVCVIVREFLLILGKLKMDYMIEIECFVKGFVFVGIFVVCIFGGVWFFGEVFKVDGMLCFWFGEWVFFFFVVCDDGIYDFVEMGLGVFQELMFLGWLLVV